MTNGRYYNFVDSAYAEYAYMLRSLARHAKILQNDIIALDHPDELYTACNDRDRVRRTARIPINVDLPKQFGGSFDIYRARVTAELSPGESQGLTEFKATPFNGSDPFLFWEWRGIQDYYPQGSLLFFVEKRNLRKMRRFLKNLRKTNEDKLQIPVLPGSMMREIYENTIIFLERGKTNREIYDYYNIPFKRGILLCGPPGCGKTMTCKWLKALCNIKGFNHRVIDLEQYKRASGRGKIAQLFRLPRHKPGILFFDDMDVMIKDRKGGEGSMELQHFLTALDGIYPAEGTVYVFTTNHFEDLDDAFVRPGRIDLFLPFKEPTDKMRRRFVEKFAPELKKFFEIEDMVERTEEYTYAEIEEIRKLIAFEIIAGKEPSIDKVFKVFEVHRKDFKERSLGFNKLSNDDTPESYYDDDEFAVPELPSTLPY